MKNILVLLVFLGELFLPLAAHAEIHALILTISDYQGGIPKLNGVTRDVESARSIARLLGTKDENIIQYHDEQLNLEGMRHAFDELDKRVVEGDKVFIYYSGHGGRQRVMDPNERCAESLVTSDGFGMIDAEMESRLNKLAGRTQKIIAMFDSCHSGGVTTRSIKNAKFTPKYWSKGGTNTCEKPINVLTRSIKTASRSAGSGAKNYVYIAAANDNEVSLDQTDKGGMATTAWLECMLGNANDLDGSGGVSVEEIQSCAQKKIDLQMQGAEGFSPQHIGVVGNPKLVMMLAGNQSAIPPAVVPATPFDQDLRPENTALAELELKPELVTPQEPAATSGTIADAGATLTDIFNGRDDRRTVEIIPTQNKLKIGSDKFSFSVRSSSAGYLYLLMVGSDGTTFDILFPNKLDGDNFIKSEKLVNFPRPTWELTAQGPIGTDHILAIVADAPRDLSKLAVTNAGPFSEVSASPAGKRGILLVTSSASTLLQAQCGESKKRNLAVKQVCSDAYGAALADIEETE
jgi:hypothetical protein